MHSMYGLQSYVCQFSDCTVITPHTHARAGGYMIVVGVHLYVCLSESAVALSMQGGHVLFHPLIQTAG